MALTQAQRLFALEAKAAAQEIRVNALGVSWLALDARVRFLEARPGPMPVAPVWSCDFSKPLASYGWIEQSKAVGRASVVDTGRGKALRLHTEPGDNNVASSGDMQRCDVYLAIPGSEAPLVFGEGEEQWWSLSVLFPDDFVFPTWHRYALAGFHHTGSTGQGNFTLGFERGKLDTDPGILGFQGYGGTQDQGRFGAPVGAVSRNVWYEFVYHVKWSATAGFFDAWMNGKRKLSHVGPTLYAGQGCYLKLANYHSPLCDPYPACIGADPPSSVIYERVIRGTSAAAVALGTLE